MNFNRLLKTFLILFLSICSVSAMDKVTISGQIIGSDGRPISRLIVSLVGDKHYRTKTNKKGAFKIKKVIGGDYYLMVSDKAGILHSEILTITGDLRDLEIKIGATFSKTPVPDYDDLISSVDFKINDNDQMVISFYFNPLEKEDIYNIEILVSDNNGKNWFSSKTVSGDVKKISGYGKKEVIWDVFSDVEELDGDVIIEVVASLVNDSYYSQNLRNEDNYMVQPQKNLNYSQKDKISARESKFYRKDGLTLKINQSRLDFTNPVYKSRIKNGSIKQEFMWGIGISIVASPAILYYDLTQNTYRIRVADTELSILYGTFDISYDEDFKEFDLFNVAHDIGMSFIVFPRIPFVTPIIGAGLQLSKLKFFNLKDENGWDVDPIDEKMYVNTSDLYAKAGLGFNIGAYSLDFYMKKSLLSKDRAWERWQVNLGFDICY